ncbi:MAG: branched-chain amino acid transport system permease protein [Halobacteriales archaeon]|jgi:branched-chain amino acid transport system permease protein
MSSVAALVPLAIGVNTLTTGLTLGALYALIAVGLTMVYGMMRILHIAHAAILVVGAYAGFYTWDALGTFWLALPAAMIVGGVVNVTVYLLLFRWIADEEPLVPLIASIGLFVALSDGYRILFGAYSKSFEPTFAFPSPIPEFTTAQFVVLALTVVLFAGVYLLVAYTRVGLAWQVTAQDREVAGAMGVNVRRIMALNFFVGGALAGAAGALVGMYYGSVSPYMGDVWAYKTFIIIVVGGMGSIPGTVIAAFVLGLFETSIIAQWGYALPRDAIAFLMMIAVLMFKPEGLLGDEESSLRRYLQNLFGEDTDADTVEEVT